MKCILKKSNFLILNFILLIFNSIMFLVIKDEFYLLYVFPISILISIVLIILDYKQYYNCIINYNSCLILTMYCFFLSRQITYFFGSDSYESIYVDIGIMQYSNAYFFSYLCIIFFYIGSLINFKKLKEISPSRETKEKMFIMLKYILYICIIPMFFYYIKLIQYASIYVYGSAEYTEALAVSGTGYFISLLRQWGVLSLILIISMKYICDMKISKIYFGIYGVVVVMSLFCGSRTEGLSMVLILILIINQKTRMQKKKLSLRKIVLLFSIILSFSAIPAFFEIRQNINDLSSISFGRYIGIESIVSAIHELGGSEQPLLIVQNSNLGLQYGSTYIAAFFNSLASFIPSSLRPSFSFFGPVSLAFAFSELLNLNYGLGFSLSAEAFYNFSWFGVIVFFIFGYIASRVLKKSNSLNNYLIKNIFVYILLTMPRRECKDLVTSLLFYFLPFVLIINYTYRKYNSE